MNFMVSTIQARLDEQSRRIMARLVKATGWTPSRIVRESLKLLDACHPRNRRRTIVGQGKFASGVADLGSNKAHLHGFGK